MSNHQHNQYARNNDPSQTQDPVLIYINNMLSGGHLAPQEHSIFKVRHQLRKVNEKAYEPEILSIGPYHYGKDKFKSMEDQKVRCMNQLLRRKGETVDRYMPALRNLEQRARNRYAETIDHLSPEKFLTMMLIDGCFIVELFRKHSITELRDRDDQLMRSDWIQLGLERDLLLLENQLPLFVLNDLYDLTKAPDENLDLIDVATAYFHFEGDYEMLGQSKHLLHLVHTCRTASLSNARQPTSSASIPRVFVSTATEMTESGVKLRARQGCDLIDIKFENGILEIPVLTVQDNTESLFRNLVAYEQHRQGEEINYMTEYIAFMDCFINSSRDVKLLRHKGIINNLLGDDDVVAQMFNKMGDSVTLSCFCYCGDIYLDVNKYCNKRWNVWMAKLRREYFHSPWAFLSVLAAIVLLLLAAAQTVFTILSYAKQS